MERRTLCSSIFGGAERLTVTNRNSLYTLYVKLASCSVTYQPFDGTTMRHWCARGHNCRDDDTTVLLHFDHSEPQVTYFSARHFREQCRETLQVGPCWMR